MTATVLDTDTRAGLRAALFDALCAEDVAWAVVGDPVGLDDPDGDVDLVIEPGWLARWPIWLHRFARAHGWRLVQILRHELDAAQYVLTRRDGADHRFLTLDVCADFVRDGRRLLRADDLLTGRHDLGEFAVPAPARAFIYYLLKKIDKGELTPAHGRYLAARWAEDAPGARAWIARFWTGPDADVLAAAATSGDWAAVRERLPALRAALHRALGEETAARRRELRRALDRIRRPAGFCVAVLGMDGSGKSSVVAGLTERLALCFRTVTPFHFRPWGEGGAPTAAPHAQEPRPVPASAAKLGYYLGGYTAGYAARVWPRLVRAGLVVFDRYLDDLLVDGRRYRFAGPHVLARRIRDLAPRPDLLLLLDAPVEAALARKPEVTPEAAARLRTAYRTYVGARPEGRIVDAGQPLDAVVADAADAVLDALAVRTEQQLGISGGAA